MNLVKDPGKVNPEIERNPALQNLESAYPKAPVAEALNTIRSFRNKVTLSPVRSPSRTEAQCGTRLDITLKGIPPQNQGLLETQ